MARGVGLTMGSQLAAFELHQGRLRSFLQGGSGPVMRDLARRAIAVESMAKRNATDRPGPRVRTGRLRGSITWRLGEDAHGPFAEIGTAVEYAPYVELGTSRAPAYPFLVPALEAAHR